MSVRDTERQDFMEVPLDIDAEGYSQSRYSYLQSIVGKGSVQRRFQLSLRNGRCCSHPRNHLLLE